MIREIIALFAIVAQLTPRIAAQPPIKASELLDKFSENQNSIRSYLVKFHTSFTANSDMRNPSSKQVMFSKMSFDVRSDGDRRSMRYTEWDPLGSSYKSLEEAIRSGKFAFSLWDGQRRLHYLRFRDGSQNPDFVMIKPQGTAPTADYASSFHEVRGWMAGDYKRVDVVLRRTNRISVRAQPEQVGGSECYVLEAETERGRYVLWIDPAHGYNIAKADVVKRPGDKIEKDKEVLPGYLINISMRILDFQEVDGVWVPMEARMQVNQHTPSGFFSSSKNHKTNEFKLNPDHDALGSFSTDVIRNGAQVRVVGIDGITYIWQNGELIPNIDKAVISEIDKMAEEIMAETIRTKSTIAPMVATVSELLKKYAETQDKLRSFIAKGESTIEYIKIPRQSGRMQKELCEFRTDGDRVNHRGSVWDKLLSKDKALYKSFLWDGESFIQYRQGSQLTDSTVFIEKNDDSKKRMIATEYKGAPLMGICGGDYDRIDSILRKADNISLRQKTEQVGNSQCYVIDAVTKRGKYMVWIDPEHGYNIAKIELQKRKGDLIGSSERVEIGMLFLLKNVRFEKIDDVWVPVEADMKQYQDNQTRIIKWHHKRTKMTLNPDHDALGSFVADDISDGTKVKVLGDPRIYVWQNGRPIVEVDSNAKP